MVSDLLSRFADASVLVIDDNPANVALLQALLRRAGLRTVHTATDPVDALARLERIDPDLVLLDLHMPRMDGYAVLAELTEHAAGSYLPVMVLTADARPEATQRALSLGARDFLTKPFDATEVALRVRNLLETRYLHKALRQNNLRLRAQLVDYQEVERAERESWQLRHDRVQRVIGEDGVRMVFQPVYDLRSGAMLGVEALARFTAAPQQGPDRWFADADQVGLGTVLELSAIRAALPALRALPESLFLAVNVSPATLLTPELHLMCESSASPRLVLELTEHVPVEDYDAITTATAALRAGGARLAVDDTGAGYAGFRHLLGLRPDIVKLDVSLTRGIHHDPARRALASAIVRFTADTHADLIAEGVETVDELLALQQLDVGWGQGYHLARPQPLEDVIALPELVRG